MVSLLPHRLVGLTAPRLLRPSFDASAIGYCLKPVFQVGGLRYRDINPESLEFSGRRQGLRIVATGFARKLGWSNAEWESVGVLRRMGARMRRPWLPAQI